MKAWIVACAAVLLVSAACFAQTPSTPPLTREALAMILSQPVPAGSPATQTSGAVLTAAHSRAGLGKSSCDATAACETGTVHCSGSSSCSSVDRNCNFGIRGSVTCDNITTQCPTACSCGTPLCCTCDSTGDCNACCRCAGGSPLECSLECS